MADHPQKEPGQLDADAKVLYQKGSYLQAADLFSLAAGLYLNRGEALLAAEMSNNQSVALLKADKPQLALEAVQGTDEVFLAAGDQLKQGMSLANQATALKELGNASQALELFSRAAVIFDAINEAEMYLQTKQSISALHLKTRNIPGALFSMQAGLEGVKKPSLKQKILLNLLKIPRRFLDR